MNTLKINYRWRQFQLDQAIAHQHCTPPPPKENEPLRLPIEYLHVGNDMDGFVRNLGRRIHNAGMGNNFETIKETLKSKCKQANSQLAIFLRNDAEPRSVWAVWWLRYSGNGTLNGIAGYHFLHAGDGPLLLDPRRATRKRAQLTAQHTNGYAVYETDYLKMFGRNLNDGLQDDVDKKLYSQK